MHGQSRRCAPGVTVVRHRRTGSKMPACLQIGNPPGAGLRTHHDDSIIRIYDRYDIPVVKKQIELFHEMLYTAFTSAAGGNGALRA